jgi:hypothetical protein
MTWSVGTIVFFVGLALMILAVLGGGLEVKEVKIPSMGRIARAVTFGIGLALLGLSLAEPEYLQRLSANLGPHPDKATSRPERTDSRPEKTVYFFNSLDPDEESNRVEVFVNGESVGSLNIEKANPTASITYKTKRLRIEYAIKGAQLIRAGGDIKTFELIGQGQLDVLDGNRYRLWLDKIVGSQKKVMLKEATR